MKAYRILLPAGIIEMLLQVFPVALQELVHNHLSKDTDTQTSLRLSFC